MKNITNNNYFNSVRDRFRLKRNNRPDVYFKAKNVTIRFRTKSNDSTILFFFSLKIDNDRRLFKILITKVQSGQIPVI